MKYMDIIKGRYKQTDDEVIINNLVKGELSDVSCLGANHSFVLDASKAQLSKRMIALKLSISSFSDSQNMLKSETKNKTAFFSDAPTTENTDSGRPLRGVQLLDEEKVKALKEAKLKALEKEIYELKKQRLADIEQEVKQIKQSAYDTAFKKGYSDATSEFDQNMSANLDEFARLIKQTAEVKQKQIIAAKANLVDLSVAIAEKIVQSSLIKDARASHAIFEEALSRVTDKDYVLIRINPEEQETFNEFKDAFESLFKDIKQLEVRNDPGIKRGGCIIETKMGFIDSSIATKLSLIKQALRAANKQS